MNPFEYLLVLAAVVLGLGLSDLAVSLNRLLEAGKRVTWDWLAPLAALVAFLKVVAQWWNWFDASALAKGLTFGMYLSVLGSAVLLFLLCAAALPSEIGEAQVDLADYFGRVRRRYWLLFAAQWGVATGVSLWAQIAIEGARFTLSPFYLILPAAMVMAFVRARWLQALAFVALIALFATELFGRSLTQ